MWLLPAFSAVSRAALGLFYRLTLSGERVPPQGPVLLVANHPNSLLDPAAVVASARRPVRFLAKAPLFEMPMIAWLVKGAGAIPVYRVQDDPSQAGQNQDTFRAVWDALAAGAAVGIFPEGTSHSEPALVPLKTGAARIALGAAQRIGHAFPLLPVGLSFREKETFRSEALVLRGEPVAWDDLAGRSPDDREVVRALTARIEDALEEVTVNLESWEDAPLVEAAEAIYAAEHPVDRGADARVERRSDAAEALRALRADPDQAWPQLAREVRGHARMLRVLGLTPAALHGNARVEVATAWTLRQLVFFGVGAPLALAGIAIYAIPYRLTGWLERRAVRERDVRATFKLLAGGLLHLGWTLALAALAGWRLGTGAGLLALLALPALGLLALEVMERWQRASAEARRFFLRARRRTQLQLLRTRQAELAARLESLWRQLQR